MGKNVESIENYALSKSEFTHTQISKVGVVGSGVIGRRVIFMIASKGVEVVFLDLAQEKIDQAIKHISQELDDTVANWAMTKGDKRSVLSRIKGTTNYNDFKDCDLVIESIMVQDRAVGWKERNLIFNKIEEVVRRDAIIATNSTTMVITKLAENLTFKDRCLGIHFLSAVPGANVVEISAGLHTSQEVCEHVRTFIKQIGRTPVMVDESPGFVSVRLIASLIGEACDTLMEGVANQEGIDLTVKQGLGLAFGPFEIADKIGIDRIVRWMENLHEEFGSIKYKPSPILKKMVRSNKLGRVTGRGFYEYDEQGNKIS